MRTANEMPKYEPGKFTELVHDSIELQLIYSGIELDIFTHLADWISEKELAKSLNCNERNLRLMLNALVATEHLEIQNGKYKNNDVSNYYLNSKSDMYIGDYILYWKDLTDIGNLTKLVKSGSPEINENGSGFFDFRSMGIGAKNIMYTGRIQKFIKMIKKYMSEDKALKVLDLGGGSGMFSIEIARNFPNSHIVVFDQSVVIPMTKKNIEEYALSKQVETKEGNFNTDPIGSGYDLIIASGIMDFGENLRRFNKKIFDALNDDGYFYVTTHGINDNYTAPKNQILGWLSPRIDGLDILKTNNAICEAIKKSGFEEVESSTIYKKTK